MERKGTIMITVKTKTEMLEMLQNSKCEYNQLELQKGNGITARFYDISYENGETEIENVATLIYQENLSITGEGTITYYNDFYQFMKDYTRRCNEC